MASYTVYRSSLNCDVDELDLHGTEVWWQHMLRSEEPWSMITMHRLHILVGSRHSCGVPDGDSPNMRRFWAALQPQELLRLSFRDDEQMETWFVWQTNHGTK